MQIVANIVFLSTFYVSFAVGLALVFGVMRTINFAHGEFYMLGGYALWLTVGALSGTIPGGLIFIVALVVGAGVVGTLGILLQLSIFHRLREHPFSIFMATLGLSYVLQVSVVQTIGPMGRSIPAVFPGFVFFEGMILPIQRLAVFGFTVVMIAGLWFFLMQTNIGRAVRASAQNKTGAMLQGISMNKIALTTMFVGSALAAMSGVLMASVLPVSPFMGGDAIWRAFIIIIVGGIGSLSGAVVAAFMFGTIDTLLTSFGAGKFTAMVDALIMLLALSFMPSGILGSRE
ncbi:MAG: branched-chain amino acid ABC transporter permease [Rhodospirillales bacterium]|jgi:branched-subunit amino acid ABC-type transport system permease component|nr:branched-chain amino acid ABC transporter permease [Rhodospirillales bacterium]MDP6591185.1 branched-chain amino acid ABC transporter permease [Alphaproteobacteria bacterium]MDP6842397.1 branched-chain amino acid ABC transporter permease [Rhodospirillales bacterium]|tara:strand:+ start:1705 stop:2568 length:864 start_codon:yes stop_codon:yes gene_type:complete